MKLTVDQDDNCYYKDGKRNYYVANVFQAGNNFKWYACGYKGSSDTDCFSDKPFNTKEQAIEHVDKTMKAMFKRILNDDI